MPKQNEEIVEKKEFTFKIPIEQIKDQYDFKELTEDKQKECFKDIMMELKDQMEDYFNEKVWEIVQEQIEYFVDEMNEQQIDEEEEEEEKFPECEDCGKVDYDDFNYYYMKCGNCKKEEEEE